MVMQEAPKLGAFLLSQALANRCSLWYAGNQENLFFSALPIPAVGGYLPSILQRKEVSSPIPTRKGVNVMYAKFLRFMLFTALFLWIFTTYAK